MLACPAQIFIDTVRLNRACKTKSQLTTSFRQCIRQSTRGIIICNMCCLDREGGPAPAEVFRVEGFGFRVQRLRDFNPASGSRCKTVLHTPTYNPEKTYSLRAWSLKLAPLLYVLQSIRRCFDDGMHCYSRTERSTHDSMRQATVLNVISQQQCDA